MTENDNYWVDLGYMDFKIQHLGTRYIRLTLQFPEGTRGSIKDYYEHLKTERFKFVLEDGDYRSVPDSNLPAAWKPPPLLTEITNAAVGQTYAPANKCIYCGRLTYSDHEKRPLGAEHIIGEGLGGTLLLPLASCRRCESITGTRIENSLLNQLFWEARMKLGVRRKKRKRGEQIFRAKTIHRGQEVFIELPLDKHPTFLQLPRFGTPDIIGRQPAEEDGYGLWIHQLTGIDALTDAGYSTLLLPDIDLLYFCQMLGKIGHAYAAANLGVDGFVSVNHEFSILRFEKNMECPSMLRFIGGDPKEYLASDALHQIGIDIEIIRALPCIVVYIRLFSNLGSPVYKVIAGELLPGQYERAWHLIEAHKYTRKQNPSDSRQ